MNLDKWLSSGFSERPRVKRTKAESKGRKDLQLTSDLHSSVEHTHTHTVLHESHELAFASTVSQKGRIKNLGLPVTTYKALVFHRPGVVSTVRATLDDLHFGEQLSPVKTTQNTGAASDAAQDSSLLVLLEFTTQLRPLLVH